MCRAIDLKLGLLPASQFLNPVGVQIVMPKESGLVIARDQRFPREIGRLFDGRACKLDKNHGLGPAHPFNPLW